MPAQRGVRIAGCSFPARWNRDFRLRVQSQPMRGAQNRKRLRTSILRGDSLAFHVEPLSRRRARKLERVCGSPGPVEWSVVAAVPGPAACWA